MLRLTIVLLASVVAGAAAAAPGDATPPRLTSNAWPDGAKWVEAHIQMENWILIGGSDRQFWFVSSLPNPAPNYPLVRDWIRWEVAEEEPGSKSSLMEVEVDCSKSKARVLETFLYRQNNLRGPFYVGNEDLEKWTEAGKGSIRQTFVQAICRGAR